MYYVLNYKSRFTKESFSSGLFETMEAAQRKYDSLGYEGCYISELSDEEALGSLVADIEQTLDNIFAEEGDIDIEDYEITEGYFFNEVNRRIKNREPGWQLLQKEYC